MILAFKNIDVTLQSAYQRLFLLTVLPESIQCLIINFYSMNSFEKRIMA